MTKMTKLWLVFLGLALLAIGHRWWLQQQLLPPVSSPAIETPSPSPTPEAASSSYLKGTFSGLLPCADCSGLQTELTLTATTTDHTQGTYTLKETYVGRTVAPLLSSGSWRVVPSDQPNQAELVIALQSKKPSSATPSYYLLVDADHLEQLMANQQPIDSSLNFTLTREKSAP